MANYHVGCGITGIFAGTLNKTCTKWVNKSDVTDEAMSAVAQFLLEHDEAMEFNYQGKRYRLAVEPQESKDKEMKVDVINETLSKDCPLKSTDEMFERIEKSLKFWGKDARVVGEVLAVLDDYR